MHLSALPRMSLGSRYTGLQHSMNFEYTHSSAVPEVRLNAWLNVNWCYQNAICKRCIATKQHLIRNCLIGLFISCLIFHYQLFCLTCFEIVYRIDYLFFAIRKEKNHGCSMISCIQPNHRIEAF